MSDFRPGGFQLLPLVIKNLLIINGLVWLAQITLLNMYGYDLSNVLGLHYWSSELFRPHQFVSYMFLHDPTGIWHLASNMFMLWMFGATLENMWGAKRFLIFYMVCGVGAALCHVLVLSYENVQLASDITRFFNSPSYDTFLQFYHKHPIPQLQGFVDAWSVQPSESPEFVNLGKIYLSGYMEQFQNGATIGASGAAFGVLFAFGFLFPNRIIFFLFFPFPIKVKYFVAVYILMELYLGFKNSAGDNVAHFAHLGGVLFAYILLKIWNKHNRSTFY